LALYSDQKPPLAILAVAGLVGTLQTLVSVWALVDDWERKAQLSADTGRTFRELYIVLENFRRGADGMYDEQQLQDLSGAATVEYIRTQKLA